MSYQYRGKPAIAGGLLTVEQERRSNAELHLELKALTDENAELDERIRTMRKDLSEAYVQLRRQIRDLDAVRAQQDLIANAQATQSELPAPKYGGREGLIAATEEILRHEYKQARLAKPRPAPKGYSHGTTKRYDAGCRCDDCRARKSRQNSQNRLNRKRRQDAAA